MKSGVRQPAPARIIRRNNKGFTLVELIIIIVILGILAAVAIPRYINMKAEAADSAARAILGGLRGAATIVYANRVIAGDATAIDMTAVLNQANIGGYDTYSVESDRLTLEISGRHYAYLLTRHNGSPTGQPSVILQDQPAW